MYFFLKVAARPHQYWSMKICDGGADQLQAGIELTVQYNTIV